MSTLRHKAAKVAPFVLLLYLLTSFHCLFEDGLFLLQATWLNVPVELISAASAHHESPLHDQRDAGEHGESGLLTFLENVRNLKIGMSSIVAFLWLSIAPLFCLIFPVSRNSLHGFLIDLRSRMTEFFLLAKQRLRSLSLSPQAPPLLA